MNDPRSSVQTIFNESLEIDDEQQRRAYLSRACGADSALRKQVDELIAAHSAAGGFLKPPEAAAGDVTPTALTDPARLESVGAMIGRYKLLEQIGEGGMGVVYMAEQREPVTRKVALKIVKLGMDTRMVVARFEAERQALAMMDHPNIAKVLDGGATETGRPYFVMDLVKGIPITQFCDENQLDTAQRLGLFNEVCLAIQHAHQKGIIHRDIKPSNILVTLHGDKPVPMVIDFGIAKATQQRLTEKTLFTQFQQWIGTPAYMSPEQASLSGLDIDTRSDIYGLGVLLYELLTGKTPFDSKCLLSAGYEEIRRIIREVEPPRPSTRLSTLAGVERATIAKQRGIDPKKLGLLVRGDLDWIVMKALEKDRARRYETASGIAADIQRHLKNEAVIACPPSQFYRFQKLVRRNKAAFAAITAVALAVLAGLGLATIGWHQARIERDNALRARSGEEAQRIQAQADEQNARHAEAKEAQQRKKAQAHELDARRKAYASDMNRVQAALAVNNLGHALRLLDLHRPTNAVPFVLNPLGEQRETTEAQRPIDLRGWEWRYLWRQCSRDDQFYTLLKAGALCSLAVSCDGKWLAVGSTEKVVIWDIRGRQEIARLSAGKAGKSAIQVAFSPTEPLLAFSVISKQDPTNALSYVRLWDGTTKKQLGYELPLSGLCGRLTFSGDGQTLVTCTDLGETAFTLWRVRDGKMLRSYPTPPLVYQENGIPFVITRDLTGVAYATRYDAKIHWIELPSGAERWSEMAAEEEVLGLALSPDGKTLASGAGYAESAIRLWDTANGKVIGRLESHHRFVHGLVFWPDGKTLATAGGDQTIQLWDVPSRTRKRVLRGHRNAVHSLALLPDKTLVSHCKDGSICLWDTTRLDSERPVTKLLPRLATWRFAPDSHSVLTVDDGGQVARWKGVDFLEKEPLIEIGASSFRSTTRYPSSLISQDGQWLGVGFTNGVLQVWDLEKRALHRQFTVPKGDVYLWAIQAQGKTLVCSYADQIVHELDLTTGQEARSWRGTTNLISLAFSPDERWCAMFSPGLLREVATGRELPFTSLHRGHEFDAAFSPDGKLLAASSFSGYAALWETDTLRQAAELGDLGAVHSVAFSPDGKRLASGSDGSEAIKLWDLDSHRDLLTLEGQGSMFLRTAFSPDGNVLGSMNWRGVLHLWRAPSWAEIEATEKAQTKAQ